MDQAKSFIAHNVFFLHMRLSWPNSLSQAVTEARQLSKLLKKLQKNNLKLDRAHVLCLIKCLQIDLSAKLMWTEESIFNKESLKASQAPGCMELWLKSTIVGYNQASIPRNEFHEFPIDFC